MSIAAPNILTSIICYWIEDIVWRIRGCKRKLDFMIGLMSQFLSRHAPVVYGNRYNSSS